MRIINGLVFNENHQMESKDLCFEEGVITENSNSGILEATDCYVLPGFIDTHIHGANGIEFYASEFSGDYKTALDYLSSQGVTSILPTLATETTEEYLSDLKRICECDDERILGYHCEGPFVNPTFKGGMHPEKIQTPNIELIRSLQEKSGDKLKIFTIAPELPDADKVIIELANMGVKVSLGHSDATYEQTKKAVELGASRITHTYNAMRPLNHREAGILGFALTENIVECELICDLHHVSRPAIDLVIKAKGINNVTMISDACFFCGVPEGKYSFNGRDMFVEGGFAKLENGTICGSACSLAVGAKNMFDIGYKPEEIAVMACVNPARAVGSENRGELKKGYRADIIVLDKDFNVKNVFIGGKRIK